MFVCVCVWESELSYHCVWYKPSAYYSLPWNGKMIQVYWVINRLKWFMIMMKYISIHIK